MSKSVIVNIFNKRITAIFIVMSIFVLNLAMSAQNKNETESIPSFEQLLDRPVKLRSEIKKVHPRIFFTKESLPKMRERAKGIDRELWLETLKDLKFEKRNPPDTNDEELYKSGLAQKKGSISQYSFAFEIAQTSFAYAIEEDEKYFEAAKKWALTACEMPVWGYKTNKPNVDLPPAHLLYALAFAYDVLYEKLTVEERAKIKNKLIKQGRLMYEYFKYKPNKKYTYSQNHTWIPMAGLAIAAYALMDEVDEVKDWAKLARAVFDRTMLTFGNDGYFYESFHYFGFAFRWMIRYFDAHLSATGENFYVRMKPKFEQMKYFAMHSILPDRENIFDFADVGDGSLNRNKISKRENLYGEYDILYRFAGIYQDSQAQAVAEFIRTETTLGTREPMWAFINHDAELKPAKLSEIPLQIHFTDNDTAFWRSSWQKDATAFAFRCAPPEGHQANKLFPKIKDWRQNTGHAHPDANSFIIFANGKYLTGDTGYSGRKMTDDHNTILVNGRGQENDGRHEVFKEIPHERLDQIKIAEIFLTANFFYAKGEAASGYFADLELKKFDRHFIYVAPDYFLIWDELQTEIPAEFSFLLNADREIKIESQKISRITNENSGLRITRIFPEIAKSEVVPQMILARGLPGSVENGAEEQRGVQLRISSESRQKNFEFLHLLQPFSIANKEFLQVSKTAQNSKSLVIDFADGSKDFVCFRNNCGEISSDSEMTILRQSKEKELKHLIVQKGKQILFGEKKILESTKQISASLDFSNKKLSGWLETTENSELKIALSNLPKKFLVNGKTVKTIFSDKNGVLVFQIPAGRHLIEGE